MSQSYSKLQGSSLIKNDRATINNNFSAIASDFAGTAFPTNELEVGMTCYRTDQKALYRYVENNVWRLEIQYIDGAVRVAEAEHAGSADSALSAGKATNDGAGNNIQKTYIKNISISGTVITVTMGDGTSKVFNTQDTDTKVTNTLNNTTKAYVTGTTSATTNTGTQVFDNGVYLDTAAGKLHAGSIDTGSIAAGTVTVRNTLNIPGGQIWIA